MTLLKELNESVKLDQDFLDKMISEIEDDAGNFGIGDESDLESWIENVFDVPGGNLGELLKQIPKDQEEDYYEKLEDAVERIAASISDDMEEEEDDDD